MRDCKLCGKQFDTPGEYCTLQHPTCAFLMTRLAARIEREAKNPPKIRFCRQCNNKPVKHRRWYCDICGPIIFKAHRSIYHREFMEQNREKVLAKQKEWVRNNQDKVRAHLKNSVWKRRAEKLQSGGTFTLAEWNALLAVYNYECCNCHRKNSESSLHADHKVALAAGGTNSIDNIQPLCKSCNSKKYTNTWLPVCQLYDHTVSVVKYK